MLLFLKHSYAAKQHYIRMKGYSLFNDAPNTIYSRRNGVEHMVKDHSDSERERERERERESTLCRHYTGYSFRYSFTGYSDASQTWRPNLS